MATIEMVLGSQVYQVDAELRTIYLCGNAGIHTIIFRLALEWEVSCVYQH